MNTGNDKFYTIGEISKLTGLQQSVLRYWEKEFTILDIKKNKFGHRIYTENDLKKVFSIKELLYKKKYTISGAKAFLNNKKSFSSNSNIEHELKQILYIIKNNKKRIENEVLGKKH